MRSKQKHLLYYILVSVAIMGSLVSLFALFELDSPRWTIPVNMLSVICVLLAVKTRARSVDGNSQ
jgi:hypothetical protein